MRTYIVYIPGLGTRYNTFRKVALSGWAIFGVSAKLVPLDWYDGTSFEQKIHEVKTAISHAGENKRVVVIGESAGATLALHLASLSSVSRVITLCGVSQPYTPISSYLQKKTPALLQATRSIPNTMDYDVVSVRGAVDTVVSRKYSTATGAKSYTFWTVSHILTIMSCLTILSPLMVTIAKKLKT